tara:strand:+ start:2732 stop:2959 length:228 start_codon:yes stop_codon:yes gene_type:complete
MFGKKVFSITGPGQFPREDMCEDHGTITGEHKDLFGDFWVVDWHNCGRDLVTKYTLMDPDIDKGIGVYVKNRGED